MKIETLKSVLISVLANFNLYEFMNHLGLSITISLKNDSVNNNIFISVNL